MMVPPQNHLYDYDALPRLMLLVGQAFETVIVTYDEELMKIPDSSQLEGKVSTSLLVHIGCRFIKYCQG
jgi:hypothetical protein